jgi:hypothetical protein
LLLFTFLCFCFLIIRNDLPKTQNYSLDILWIRLLNSVTHRNVYENILLLSRFTLWDHMFLTFYCGMYYHTFYTISIPSHTHILAYYDYIYIFFCTAQTFICCVINALPCYFVLQRLHHFKQTIPSNIKFYSTQNAIQLTLIYVIVASTGFFISTSF